MPPMMRRLFWFLNKFFMVPIFRLGLGPWFGNPFSGYIMVLKAIGRKTGKIRFTPVNYTIYQGNVYCISAGRETSDWYRNILASPDIEVIMPTGALYGHVSEERGQEQRVRVARQVLQNAGFAGFFEGYNPFTISDEELSRRIDDLPILRIEPKGIANGAVDPGGGAWVWAFIVTLVIVLVAVR